jgi:hypothetical protein
MQTIIKSGQIIFLKSHAGSGAVIDIEDSSVQARWVDHGAWQAIVVEKAGSGSISSGDQVFLKSSQTGAFVDVEGEQVQARWSERGTWQSFTVEKQLGGHLYVGDVVCFKAHTGNYIEVNAGQVKARWNECEGWQQMRIEVGGARRLRSSMDESQPQALRSGVVFGISASLFFFISVACLRVLLIRPSAHGKHRTAASVAHEIRMSTKIYPSETTDDTDSPNTMPVSCSIL